MQLQLVLIVCALLVCVANASSLWMPNFFQSNMVLQRAPQQAVIHGLAQPASVLLVNLTRHDTHESFTFNVKTDSDSKWEAQLPAQLKGGPATITVTDSATESLTLENVLFGDVILCSGQSNMEFDVTGVFNYSAEQADAGNYPNMRLYQIDHNPQMFPVPDAPVKSKFKWVPSTPQNLGDFTGDIWESFSAMCYYTGRELARRDPTVPLGLLTTCFGGTSDRRWVTPSILEECGVHEQEAGYNNSDLWFGMITPFLKMRFAAALWYQGESDSTRPFEYACTFPRLIQSWRKEFNLPNLPFGFVELAAYYPVDFSMLRVVQAQALNLSHTFMASAIDMGDPDSPYNGVHPRNKQEVARRLSLGLMKELYGVQQVTEGPKPKKIQLTNNAPTTGKWTLNIQFTNADGLFINDTANCQNCCKKFSPIDVWANGNWTNIPTSQLHISGDSVQTVGSGPLPTSIRGLWGFYAECSFYNSERLSSSIFVLDIPALSVVA
jgi:sialate O-acetylesterase